MRAALLIVLSLGLVTPAWSSRRTIEDHEVLRLPVRALEQLDENGTLAVAPLKVTRPAGYTKLAKSHFQGIQRLPRGEFVISGSGDTDGHLFITRAPGHEVVKTINVNRDAAVAETAGDFWRAATHVGGIQAIGDYVVVPLEHEGKARILFYDLTNPGAPRLMPYRVVREDHEAGAVGMACPP